MKFIFGLWIVLSLILLSSCGDQSSSNKESSKKALEILVEQAQNEAKARAEKVREDEELSRLTKMVAEKRVLMEEDLSAKLKKNEAKREILLEIASIEMARRQVIVSEVNECVASLNIARSSINEKVTIKINNEPAKEGRVFVSPAGFSITYTGKDGDYYYFEMIDESFEVKLKRTEKGFCFAAVTHKKELAEGIPAENIPDTKLPTFTSAKRIIPARPFQENFVVIAATYGAGHIHRDVRDIVKSKIQYGQLGFSAHSGELGGDPIFGQVKTFYIKYLYQGKVYEKSFSEGSPVLLP